MKIKKIAIVGHINAGKSSLFNALLKRKKAIVSEFPGLTLDRNYGTVQNGNRAFILIDTGGFMKGEQNYLQKRTIEQTMIAIEEADIIIFLLEFPDIQAVDYGIAEILRGCGKDIIAVLNKIDNKEREYELAEFYKLGFDPVIPVSVVHNKNIEAVMDKISELIPESDLTGDDAIKVAIVGKPNSGKSTLLNKITGSDRSIVSEKPGTTRDAIDIRLKRNKKEYIFIDTAGIRKKGRINTDVEYYSLNRAIRAIKDCDICLHLIDAASGLSDNDKKIASEISGNNKPSILLLNKWDLIEDKEEAYKKIIDDMRFKFPHAKHLPIYTISAMTGLRVADLFTKIDSVLENNSLSITTGQLNRILEEAVRKFSGPKTKGALKIYYGTQVRTSPPIFLLFINKKSLFTSNYESFLKNHFRTVFNLEGVPLTFRIKEHTKEDRNG